MEASQTRANRAADPTILFVMMKHYKEEATAAIEEAEIANTAAAFQRHRAERLNAQANTLTAELEDARTVIDALWRRLDVSYAHLRMICIQHPDIAADHMPWLNMPTPPNTPENIIDLTTDEELEG